MLIEIIGNYLDRASGRRYVVEKITRQSKHSPISGRASVRNGSFEYKTACGIDVRPLSESLSEFELIQVDGTIYRLED